MIYKKEIKEIAKGFLENYKQELNEIKDEEFKNNLIVFLEDLSKMTHLANDNMNEEKNRAVLK